MLIYAVIFQIKTDLILKHMHKAMKLSINTDMRFDLSTSTQAFNNMVIVRSLSRILKQETVPVSFSVVSKTANRCLLV